MASDRVLDAYWDGRPVGRFRELGSTLASFSYDPGYDGPPISAALRRDGSTIEGRAPHEFLANLLPEIARDQLARRHRLAQDDAFGLIGQLGRECAGALQFVPGDETPDHPPPRYRPLTETMVDRWIDELATRPTFEDPGGSVRQTLAGEQPKAAFFFDSGNRAFVPQHGAITSHILKPALPHAPGNTAHVEYLCMALARRVLGREKVPESDLWRDHFRVRRYDRPVIAGSLVRRHQEDFCQALGESAYAKYESARHRPAHPYLARCMGIIDRLGMDGLIASPAIERGRLLEQVVFNVLIHNAGAQLKDYALLHDLDTGISVAPLHDASCTAAILDRGRSESADMGLWIGATLDIRSISGEDWDACAISCGLTSRLVRNYVKRLADALLEHLDDVRSAVMEEHPQCEPAVEQTLPLIRQQVRRILAQL